MAHLLSHPTQDLVQIHIAQDSISSWYKQQQDAYEIHTLLSTVSDLPRIAQQITQKKRMIHALRQLAEQIQHLHAQKIYFSALQTIDSSLLEVVDLFTADILAYIQQ